ncbi:MAG: neutral ceramidase [Thermoleophilaceae bacterium]|nr:neutral ceramidase [Thermoleophilaceae bacterium]
MVRAVRAVVVAVVALVFCSQADAATIQAGVGRSDVTPPTGFATMGYVRSDAVARGQHTRLFARAIVLREGNRKLALVTTDLGFTPGGLLVEAAQQVRKRGFSEQNVIISASHTHSAPAGYANFESDNFVAPTMGTPTEFKVAGDRKLYGFLVKRVALAIARADGNLGPARVGWGSAQLAGVTDNRSLEAHLANFGFDLPYGTGRVDQDPRGYIGTIDPQVDVLRVDRIGREGHSIPMGAWLDFADHGTVNPYTFGVYNGDHHGPASRIFERTVRRLGKVPRGREVVGAYGNGDAGDMTAGFRGRGPAFAERVGAREAAAMLTGWKRAGRRMARWLPFDTRWTRSCFCGRAVSGGQVDTDPVMGYPFFTGSEENRGPLYDETHVNHEGGRLPVGVGPQSRKIETVGPPEADFPRAVPLMVVRLGDHAIATIPGEMTVEMGRRTRAAVVAAFGSAGVRKVALAGYANEFLHYFTTPEEYDQQHYEGGSTLYGKYSSNLIRDDLATLAGAIAGRRAAPGPVSFDARNGLVPDFSPYEDGAAQGAPAAQPVKVQRLRRATFAWRGGERGFDRPFDRAFVAVERRVGKRWRKVTDDLGLEILWRVDDSGRYTTEWQVPLSGAPGRYRFVVTARRYRLRSAAFTVAPSSALSVHALGGGRFTLDYPAVDAMTDLTSRPAHANGGIVRGSVRGRKVTSRKRRGTVFTLPAGVRIAAGAARDRYGNRNGAAVTLSRAR